MSNKLTIHDLKPYLGYGVVTTRNFMKSTLHGKLDTSTILSITEYDSMYRPVLKPLSMLKDDEVFFREFKKLVGSGSIETIDDLIMKCYHHNGLSIDYWEANLLAKHRYDFQNLIKQGKAIAVTDEINPYKD